ncbi:MAG: PspA/IM30 family protein [Desulfobacterales bacterium]|nr:PspA/IM30 family protein [Desulfobacterales bacterium]
MKEGLIARVGRIVSGSVHSLIDAIENAAPETVMEEAIREIDGAIDEVRLELGKVVAGKHLASTRLLEANQQHEDLAAKIELALKESREDLAEAAIARQLDLEAQIPVLEATINDSGSQEKELEGYIAALQAKKREMKEEMRQFRQNVTESTPTPEARTQGTDVEGKVAKASSAFERVVEKATGIPGSGREADRHSAVKLAELEELSRKNRIQERLAAVKSEIGKK